MPVSLLVATAAFVSTNLDDIFLLMLLFSQEDTRRGKGFVAMGQFIGIGALIAASFLGSFVLQSVPRWGLALLGFIPIALGVREALHNRSASEEKDVSAGPVASPRRIGDTALLTISNGADNVGVYVPLFTGYTPAQSLLTVVVFLLLTALWCWLGERLSALPVLRGFLQKYRRLLVPLVFIALGVFILVKNLLP